MKRQAFLACLGTLLLAGCSSVSPAEPSPSPSPPPSPSPSQIYTLAPAGPGTPVEIVDFESGTGAMPDGWSVEQWMGRSEFVWEAEGNCRSGRCISIETTPSEGNDARWLRTLQLTPDTWYILSGWIKGENLQNTEGNTAANVFIGDEFLRSDGLSGTFGWTRVEATFQTDASGQAKIGCRLGFWGSLATGKAYFDDLEITPLHLNTLDGQHHYLVFETDDIVLSGISDQNLAQWQARLDQVYEAYHELVGDAPYGGERIGVTSVRGYPGGWAVAGNPILWYRPYIAESLQMIENQGDWSFGIIHELGHDFDLDYRWVWDAELWANVKLEFVVERLDATVVFDGEPYRGEELRGVFATSYADARSRGEYNWAVIHVRFAELRDEYGWEPFQQAFRGYPEASDPDCPSSRLDKFLLFIDLLSDFTGEDVPSRFEPGEWEWMVEDLGV